MRIYQRIQNPDATWFLFDLFFDRPSLPLRFYRVLTTGWRCRTFLLDHVILIDTLCNMLTDYKELVIGTPCTSVQYSGKRFGVFPLTFVPGADHALSFIRKCLTGPGIDPVANQGDQDQSRPTAQGFADDPEEIGVF